MILEEAAADVGGGTAHGVRAAGPGSTRSILQDVNLYEKEEAPLVVSRRITHLGQTLVDQTLDDEGGYTVWGKLAPAALSLDLGGLPIGLAHGVKLVHDVSAGKTVRWTDVAKRESDGVVRSRLDMEAYYRTNNGNRRLSPGQPAHG